jgi:hypothetical protein
MGTGHKTWYEKLKMIGKKGENKIRRRINKNKREEE